MDVNQFSESILLIYAAAALGFGLLVRPRRKLSVKPDDAGDAKPVFSAHKPGPSARGPYSGCKKGCC